MLQSSSCLFPPKVKGERDLWFEFIIINLGLNVETGKYSSADVEENSFQLPPHIQTQGRRQTKSEGWKRKNVLALLVQRKEGKRGKRKRSEGGNGKRGVSRRWEWRERPPQVASIKKITEGDEQRGGKTRAVEPRADYRVSVELQPGAAHGSDPSLNLSLNPAPSPGYFGLRWKH